MISTIPDMMAYAPALATGKGLLPETARQRLVFTVNTSDEEQDYGLGSERRGRWLGHDGAIIGYNGLVYYLPESQTTLVAMVGQWEDDVVTPGRTLWLDVAEALYPGSTSRS